MAKTCLFLPTQEMVCASCTSPMPGAQRQVQRRGEAAPRLITEQAGVTLSLQLAHLGGPADDVSEIEP